MHKQLVVLFYFGFELLRATCDSSYRLYFWLRVARVRAARRIDYFGFELCTDKQLVVSNLLLASSGYVRLVVSTIFNFRLRA